MSDALPDPSTVHLRRLVARRSLAERESVPIESVDLDEAAASGPGADAVTDRVEATLQDIPDPTAPLSRGEAIAFEAVIRTDGTRPTMLVRDDAVDTDHPLAGDWAGTLTATRDTMRDRVGAVGRIEPANYGVKRLAPGIAHRPLGSLPGDGRGWVFGARPHDARR
ncbi:MAG: hypothetical protein ACRDT0_12745 [Pseudonocardiaceae bacterium]